MKCQCFGKSKSVLVCSVRCVLTEAPVADNQSVTTVISDQKKDELMICLAFYFFISDVPTTRVITKSLTFICFPQKLPKTVLSLELFTS